MSPSSLVARARELGAPLAAIEVYWGDAPGGLYLALVAIAEQASWRHPRYSELELARIPAGRTHTGPAWPEAEAAAELGEQLARELGVPFHFESRDRPRHEAVRWWSRGQGHRCDDCGVELVQHPDVHWFGMCYPCHVAREDRLPRLGLELVHDRDANGFEAVRDLVDRALLAAGAGRFYAGSRVAGAQAMWFLTMDAQRATAVAIAALREAGLLDEIRLRAAGSVDDPGDVVWPATQFA